MVSAREKPEVVREYLCRECAEGRVLGPLDPDQYPRVHVSRFGVIPKGSTGKWRLVMDLSAPEGHSVNDGIRNDWCSLSYLTVDNVVSAVQHLRQGSQRWIFDVHTELYRSIPMTGHCWV